MSQRPARRHVNFFLISLFLAAAPAQASTCYGRVGAGSIVGAVALPAAGPNFEAYSRIGVQMGRTHVHARVRDVLLEAYAALARDAPGKYFVYGETGLEDGGRMRPHRTHQNGLSVDFMVPVVDGQGKSVPLPSSPLNKFGYGLEFDARGRAGELRIDFEALAAHLVQLREAARRNRVGIALVILDPPLMAEVMKTSQGKKLHGLPFMKGRPWIRHDEHYHVDFALPCRPGRAQARAG